MQYPRFFAKAVTGTMVAGRAWSTWALAGSPGAGAFDTTLNGLALSAPQNGQIPFTNPATGNAYLARLAGTATIAGMLLLCDRLWHNGGYTITSTSAQNSTTPAWPARSADGTANGEGVLLGCEISAVTGAGTPTITSVYTNQAGTASKTAVNLLATVAASAAGSFYFMGLQSGDTGMRSLQSITLNATWTSGTMNMVAYRILAALEIGGAFVPNAIDALTSGMPRLYNDSVPFLLFVPSAVTSTAVTGQVVYTHG